MKSKILWFLTFLPAFVTLIAVQFMEDKIPAHYDAIGKIDRWGSKYESFIFAIIIIIMTLFWSLFLKYFRKKQVSTSDDKLINEARQNEKVIYYVAVGVALLFNVMHYSFMFTAMIEAKNNMHSMAIDMNVLVNVMFSIFLIIIGNIMPKSKLNFVAGVRTTWSMKNDITWAKSNRFACISLIISGFIIIIESILIGGILSTFIMLGILIVDGITSTVYSYIIYKKLSSV